jgi:hypothetical protein
MEVKLYQPGDENQILELFKECFGKSMTLEYWNWRFNKNPFDSKKFISLMWENDLLVGHYAVSSIDMIIDNQKHKTALSMTTMTHPKFGGRGVFKQLANHTYAQQIKNDHLMVWGFPNNSSHYGFKKNLEWNDISILGMMSLPIENFKASNSNFSFKKLNIFDKESTTLFNQTSKEVFIDKNIDYLNWRYLDNPFADYKVLVSTDNKVGIIYKKIKSFSITEKFEIDILEINFNNSIDALNIMLSAILREENGKILKFNLWDSIFSENQIILEKTGFRINSPINYLSARLFKNNDTAVNFKNWDISFGYSDIF